MKKDEIGVALSCLSDAERIRDEETLDDNKYLNEANKGFSKLLIHYVNRVESSFDDNKPRKKEYYDLFRQIFIVSYVVFVLSLIVCLILYIIFRDAILFMLLLPPLIELLSTTIIIPRIIAQYLFNTDEDRNLSNIISKLEKYYEDVRHYSRNK